MTVNFAKGKKISNTNINVEIKFIRKNIKINYISITKKYKNNRYIKVLKTTESK